MLVCHASNNLWVGCLLAAQLLHIHRNDFYESLISSLPMQVTQGELWKRGQVTIMVPILKTTQHGSSLKPLKDNYAAAILHNTG